MFFSLPVLFFNSVAVNIGKKISLVEMGFVRFRRD